MGGGGYNVCLFKSLIGKGALLLNTIKKINEVDFKGD